ncbi:MAG: HAMP domain-containing sensor histidine kinase [Pseudomonadota bacterium]
MKDRLPKTTFGLVIQVSVLMGIAFLALASTVLIRSHEALEVQLYHRVEAETGALLSVFEQGGFPALADAVTRREILSAPSRMHYLLSDSSGRRVAGAITPVRPPVGRTEFLRWAGLNGTSMVAQAQTTGLPNGGWLVVAADRGPVNEIDRAILSATAGAFGAMLLFGVGGAWALAAVTRKRLDRMNQTAQAIIGGDLSRRIVRDGSGSEFDGLAATLNLMLERNSALLEGLQQISSDIAHDLRTPLNRLHHSLESAINTDGNPATFRAAVELALERVAEMQDIFSALLRISEIETLQVRSAFKVLDLSGVVEQVIDAFRPDVEAGCHSLQTGDLPKVHVNGDRRLLSQLLVNLLENAMRHTSTGSSICVELKCDAAEATLSVSDNGPGIPQADHETVLRRFGRLEQSRSTPGYGLGLSMVSAIARAHFARIDFSDNQPGLVVTVKLKIVPPPTNFPVT